jgi:trimeric autotransporter adhesin
MRQRLVIRVVRVTAIGYQALRLSTGNDNTAVGFAALTSNTTGIENTAVGRQALLNTNTTGSSNTAVR